MVPTRFNASSPENDPMTTMAIKHNPSDDHNSPERVRQIVNAIKRRRRLLAPATPITDKASFVIDTHNPNSNPPYELRVADLETSRTLERDNVKLKNKLWAANRMIKALRSVVLKHLEELVSDCRRRGART